MEHSKEEYYRLQLARKDTEINSLKLQIERIRTDNPRQLAANSQIKEGIRHMIRNID